MFVFRNLALAATMACSTRHARTRRLTIIFRYFITFLLAAVGHASSANDDIATAASVSTLARVFIVGSEANGTSHDRFVAVVESGLRAFANVTVLSESRLQVVLSTQKQESATRGLVIVVGTRAAQALCAKQLDLPLLLTLIPSPTFNQTIAAGCSENKNRASVLFLDQPLARQILAMKLTFPNNSQFTVLLGPEARIQRPRIEQLALRHSWQATFINIDRVDEVFSALERRAEHNRPLLAVPDPLVFNSKTAAHILLAAYRYGMPVIGYSESYVTAGALLAVYSTPEQLGQQAVDAARQFLSAENSALPEPTFPTKFSVAINRQVGRSLGLTLPDEDTLLFELRRDKDDDHDPP